MSSRRLAAIVLVTALAGFWSSCATKSTPLMVTSNPSIQLAPSSASVQVQKTQQFTATASGSDSVTWSVNGVVNGNSTFGTIDSTGLYTAPAALPTQNPVTVSAAITSNTSFAASSLVTITPAPPPVSVTISPKVKTIQATTSQQFTATVQNATDTSVTWQVDGVTGGSSSSGTISTSGNYTAPATVPVPNPVTVTAVSNADSTKSDSASITITALPPPISVAVTPPLATVIISQAEQFTANVSGTSNQVVTWGLSGNSCSGNACGTITSSGLYQAPASVPSPDATVTVKATSQADTTKSGTATVTVTLVPTPGVTLNPPANQSLAFNTALTVQANLTNDPANLGVTWSIVCVSDGEPTPDCANDPPGDGDADIKITSQTTSAITLNVPFADQGADVVFNLTATSVATGTGGSHGAATIQVHYHP